MRTTIALAATLLFTATLGNRAVAQELTAAERTAAVARARAMAECLERSHHQMQRLLRLVGQAEAQRQSARDAAVRRDAEAAIESIVTRMADVQRDARGCLGTTPLPTVGTTVVVRPPADDPAADSIAGSGGSIHTVESDVRLTRHIHVVRGQQVDGQGHLDPGVVRGAVRSIGSRLDACYDRYLRRGSVSARSLDLVFRLRGSGSARAVDVENSAFSDRTFERCVRSAGQRIRVSRAPVGGEAVYSYRLRFGGAP